jgi:hypothetical protein
VPKADRKGPAGHDLDILDRHVGGVDLEGVRNAQAAEHRPVPGHGHGHLVGQHLSDEANLEGPLVGGLLSQRVAQFEGSES